MFLKKTYEGIPIESPIISFYWKYAPFFHILNDDMYMMLSVGCFWIFNKKKRCVKSWASFFNKKEFFFLTYAWIWIPSGFIKAVNFKIFFLAHLTQRVMWAILITLRPSPSSVVRRKLFQKSSPLKVLDQWKPNLVWIITRVSSFKIVSGDAVHQPTWPLLLKIEHMVKLQVLGNNSKTVNNIKNLTWVKNDQHILPTLQFWSKSDYPSSNYCPFFIKFVKF